MKRTYKEYGIRITDESGARMVKINKNVDMSSFSIARQVYGKTKNRYIDKNEDMTIELVGITLDGEVGNVIYSKTFVREVISEDEELMDKTDDIVENVKHELEILVRKREYHINMLSAMDKKQEVILHNIEEMKEFSDKDKLQVFSDLEEIRHPRRFHKDETTKLKILNSIINLDNVSELFSKVNIPIKKEHKFLDKHDLETLKIMKEVKYNSDKDRVYKTSELQKKYDKVINDSVKKVLICYNKANKKLTK